MENKTTFFLKLHPPRATFIIDMNDEEQGIMQQHINYWKPYVDDGTVIVLGPVLDPNGGYGISIVSVNNEEEIKQLIANDPANGLNTYEYHPMMAVIGKR